MIKIDFTDVVKEALEKDGYTVNIWDADTELKEDKEGVVTLAFIYMNKQPDGEIRYDLASRNVMTCSTNSWHIFNKDIVLINFYWHGKKQQSSDLFQNLYKIFIKQGLHYKDLLFHYRGLKPIRKEGFENWYRVQFQIEYKPADPKKQLKMVEPEVVKAKLAATAKKMEKAKETKKNG